MDKQEHLNKIVAKCRELLTIADKRTPGKWTRQSKLGTSILCENSQNNGRMICDLPDSSPRRNQFSPNVDFISECAGAAEAGWLVTVAVIESLETVAVWHPSGAPKNEEAVAIDAIINAWPEEIL